VSAGFSYTCGVSTSGEAFCWGENHFGTLGDGTTNDRLVPTLVAAVLSFATVSAGDAHTCGVTTSGAAYCWGHNIYGELGDGTTTDRTAPTPVTGSLTFAGVNTGGLTPWYAHTCGVTMSCAAYCWGGNFAGELGDGTATQRLVPTAVAFP